MRLLRRSVALGALVVAVSSPAGETGAPLESTKRELRKLESDQNTSQAPRATEGLRGDLPLIQTPGQEPLPFLQLSTQERQERKKQSQKNSQNNWLVNGVTKLEKNAKGESAAVPGSDDDTLTDGSELEPKDTSDPQYLLKIYDSEKKAMEARHSESKPQHAPQADPLAPFLQGWLGNSPVRGQFFDEFVRKADGASVGAGATPAGSVVANPGYPEVGASRALPETGAAPESKPNPYLVEPASVGADNRVGLSLPVLGAPAPSLVKPLFEQPATPVTSPVVEVRQTERKAPPAPLAEDKKYFPQLKRF